MKTPQKKALAVIKHKAKQDQKKLVSLYVKFFRSTARIEHNLRILERFI